MWSTLLILNFIALCFADPWLEIVTYVDRDSDNCPDLNNTGVKTGAFTGFAVNLTGALTCIPGYGIDVYGTTTVAKSNSSLGVAYTATLVTLTEYFGAKGCLVINATRTPVIRTLNTCIKEGTLGSQNISRWFQTTPKMPPGYELVDGGKGAPSDYSIELYVGDIGGTCALRTNTLNFANNQRCQKVRDGLFINAYCDAYGNLTGCTSANSDCSGTCQSFGTIVGGECVVDTFYNTSLTSRLIVRCSSSALSVGVALVIALLAFLL